MVKYFGCNIRNAEKLTRENYIELDKKSIIRNDYAKHIKLTPYEGLSKEEAYQLYIKNAKAALCKKFMQEIKIYFDKKADILTNPKYAEKCLIGYKKDKVDNLIKTYLSNYYLNNIDKDTQVLYINAILQNNHDKPFNNEKLERHYKKYQDQYIKIQNLTIADMLDSMVPQCLHEIYYNVNSPYRSKLYTVFQFIINYGAHYAVMGYPYLGDIDCDIYQNKALYNFDINMQYFNSLDNIEFNKSIHNFMLEHPEFKKVNNLKLYDSVPGIYIMILDEYNQIYIGISKNIKGRIQSHWSAQKSLNKRIFGPVNSSILSIDSFKHLDTTRILVSTHPEFSNDKILNKFLLSEEYNLVENAFPSKYVCNRCSGGGTSYFEAILSRKKHDIEGKPIINKNKYTLDDTVNIIYSALKNGTENTILL